MKESFAAVLVAICALAVIAVLGYSIHTNQVNSNVQKLACINRADDDVAILACRGEIHP